MENKLKGILECPLRKETIEFKYSPGDTVSELKDKIEQFWGQATTGRKHDLYDNGGFWETGRWVIMCQTNNGSYLPLKDKDEIPVQILKTNHESRKDLISQWFKDRNLNLEGLIHGHDIRDKIPLDITINLDQSNRNDYDIRLIVLVVITGG